MDVHSINWRLRRTNHRITNQTNNIYVCHQNKTLNHTTIQQIPATNSEELHSNTVNNDKIPKQIIFFSSSAPVSIKMPEDLPTPAVS